MNQIITRFTVLIILSLGWSLTFAQDADLLIKGGRLIDPRNNIDAEMDIAIKDGRILQVENNLAAEMAEKVINAEGMIVTPGLIDCHVHVFYGTLPDAAYSNGFNSVPPDPFTFRSGVTTVVDAGSAGWKNFNIFKKQTIDHSKTRVLAFLNIVGSGMKGGEIEQNIEDMDPVITAEVAKEYKDIIVGIKLAHFMGPDWTPTERTVEAGKRADMPVMIDFGGSDPPLSLETLFMDKLRPGDIFTHAYANVSGRMSVVENGKVQPFATRAQERGIVFDVGHGGGSFRFDQAVPAIKQGFKPNSISTDLHIGSMNAGMKDMLNVMSKFLNMGVSLQEVVAMSTWVPAQSINRTDLGHLSEGAIADISLFTMKEGDFGFFDTASPRRKINGNQKLECEITLKDGQVVWDLNGRTYKGYGE